LHKNTRCGKIGRRIKRMILKIRTSSWW
jgi:hypothetical protein